MLVTLFATIAILILINALYVAAEFSSVSARRTRIHQMAAEGNRRALLLLPILTNPERLDNYIAACQLGITASSLLLGIIGQGQLAELLRDKLVGLGAVQNVAAESIAATVVLIFLTIAQVLLGELVPKSIGVRFPEQLALWTVMPMRISAWILRPFTWLFNGAGRLILRLLKVDTNSDGHSHSHEPGEIELLVAESAKGGLLDAEERVMLRNVFRLGELTAQQVMIPRPRLEAAPADISPHDLLVLIADSSYTRIPIYQGDIDHIIGFVHLKDIFRVCQTKLESEITLQDYIREAPFVPETMPVEELWELLKTRHHYMAIVFDEYGGTAGLVTQEDLIEEIFGELQDEFDQEKPLIARDESGELLLRGDILVNDVNEHLLLNLPTDRANTLGGLITSLLGRPAQVGDKVAVAEHTLHVRRVEDRAVTRVSLNIPADAEPVLDGQRPGGAA